MTHSLTMDRWDLGPGEAISQSPLTRAAQGERTLPCPPPTLDTDEFLVQSACPEDGSSVDSLADFDLAPGEVRSQIPSASFYGSQFPQCPPPTLDTQEFENNSECEPVWFVEDPLACSLLAQSGCGSQGPVVDMPNAPEQFCRPYLDSREFEIRRVISDNVWRVEDSCVACSDCAPGEAGSEGIRNHISDLKSQGFRSSMDVLGCRPDDKEQRKNPPSNFTFEEGKNGKIGSSLFAPLSTSAAKRSLSPSSSHGDSGKSHKQVKSDPKGFNDLHPLPSTERSSCGESHRKVSILTENEDLKKPNLEFTRSESFNLCPLVSSKSPTKSNSDVLSCLSERCQDIWAIKSSEDVTNRSGYPSKNGAVSESLEVGVDAKTFVQTTGSDGQSMAKAPGPLDLEPFLFTLDFESATSRQLGKANNKGWLCPRAGKKIGPASKQLSLDRWINLV